MKNAVFFTFFHFPMFLFTEKAARMSSLFQLIRTKCRVRTMEWAYCVTTTFFVTVPSIAENTKKYMPLAWPFMLYSMLF